MNIAGLRFFSVYQGDGGTEEHKSEYANVIAQFADNITNSTQPKLYGDGEQTHNFTYVSDVVRGVELTAERELTGIDNLGTGENYSFDTVVEMINEELGTDVEPTCVKNAIVKSVYVHDTCAHASKIKGMRDRNPRLISEGRFSASVRSINSSSPSRHSANWHTCLPQRYFH